MKPVLKIGFWLSVFAIAVAVVIYLRPYVDISYTEAMQYSAGQMKQKADSLWLALGAEPAETEDALLSEYLQRKYYFMQHINFVLQDHKPLKDLSTENGEDLNVWKLSLLQDTLGKEIGSVRPEGLFKAIGRAQFTLNHEGRVMRYLTNQNQFVGGTEAENVDAYIASLFPILGYDIQEYELIPDYYDAEGFVETDSISQVANQIPTDSLILKRSYQLKGPPTINRPFQLDFEVLQIQSNAAASNRNIYILAKMVGMQEVDKEVIDAFFSTYENLQLLILIFSIVFLAVVGFVAGLIPITQGRVDWKQVLITFLLFTAAMAFWRGQVLFRDALGYLEWGQLFLRFFNDYALSVVTGIYASIIYLGWSTLARDQKQKGFRLINEFWHFRFYYRQTGSALFKGIAFGATIMAVFFVGAYVNKVFIFNIEGGDFNTSEASSFFPPLTVLTSAYTTTWLVSIGHIALVFSLLNKWIKSKVVVALLTTLTFIPSGVMFFRYFATSGPLGNDFLMMVPVAVLVVLFFIRNGLFALSVAMFFYVSMIHSLPFLHPNAGAVPLTNGLIIAGGHLLLLLVGVGMYIKAPSVYDTREEVPDYERKYQTQQRLVKEIEVAQQTQMQLMPDHHPRIEGADIYGFFMPSFEVGGDYYYYYRLEQDNREQLAFTLLDVSGKAMRAAIQAVFTSGLLLSRMSTDSPDDILDSISPMVYEHTDARTFITCIVGRYNPTSREVNFANAGHCMPLLKRGNQAHFVETPAPRFPLGMKKEVDYIAKTIRLEPGDTFILYSDGFPEAEDRLRNRIGFKGVQDYLANLQTEDKSAREIAESIKAKIIAHSGTNLADDTTVIVIKIEPSDVSA